MTEMLILFMIWHTHLEVRPDDYELVSSVEELRLFFSCRQSYDFVSEKKNNNK